MSDSNTFSALIAKAQAGDANALKMLQSAANEMSSAYWYSKVRDPNALDAETEKGYQALRSQVAQAGVTPEHLQHISSAVQKYEPDARITPEQNEEVKAALAQELAGRWKSALLDDVPGQKPVELQAETISARVPPKKIVLKSRTVPTKGPAAAKGAEGSTLQQKAAQGILNMMTGGGGGGGRVPFDQALEEK